MASLGSLSVNKTLVVSIARVVVGAGAAREAEAACLPQLCIELTNFSFMSLILCMCSSTLTASTPPFVAED